MGGYDEPMTELTKRQKYVKEKYFKPIDGDPGYYKCIYDDGLNLFPYTMYKLIDIIIKILEEESDGEINWGKIT